MNTEEKIKIMQAFVDGKAIERLANGKWELFRLEPTWNWYEYSYRIKPEPKVIYVNEYESAPNTVHCSSVMAHAASQNDADRKSVPYIELTEEIKQKLNIK